MLVQMKRKFPPIFLQVIQNSLWNLFYFSTKNL
jgi:hypothetical protein